MSIVASKPLRSARKAKGDGHMRRAEILDAAERIFVAQGYEGATIRKIADEVGVSSTALYMHFKDKDQILLEICTQTMQRLLDNNSAIAAKPIDSVQRVHEMLEGYTRFGLEHPNAYRLVFCSPSDATVMQPNTAAEIGAACYERFSGVVREIAAEGRLRLGEPGAAAQALWAACHGLVALMIYKPDVKWADRDELIEVMVGGLLHGLTVD